MTVSKDDWTASVLVGLNVLAAEDATKLYETSSALLATLYHALTTSTQSILPSYTTSLPRPKTSGTAIAVDLGGSTLRVAVIELRPHNEIQGDDVGKLPDLRKVVVRNSWSVGDEIKSLRSKEFFDWIAGCVGETVAEAGLGLGQGKSVGVTWSFPVTQTSPASGTVNQMGKGYVQWQEIAGTDLRSHFEGAFARRGLQLYMNALVNDTEATLLSHAFANPSTSISLILGTGLNAALRLPVSVFSPLKLGDRPKEWLQKAAAVLVNTEISMFGAGVFPMTDADRKLDAGSTAPGFQPLEQMTSGRYLGEIVRLTLEKGVKAGHLFDGVMPIGMRTRFGFDTGNMAVLETGTIDDGIHLIWKAFYCQHAPTREDVKIIQSICRAVSARAAVYLGVTLFTIWRLQRDTMLADHKTIQVVKSLAKSIAIAYCGTVVEKHPTIRNRIQEILDRLVDYESAQHDSPAARLILEEAGDSGLLGAAVASVMNAEDDENIMRSKLMWNLSKSFPTVVTDPVTPPATFASPVAMSPEAPLY